MADETTSTNTNDAIEQIAVQIDQIARSIYTEHSEWLAAAEETANKNGELVNKRLKLCSDIAKIADDGEWQDDHIKAAIKMATARIAGNTPGDDKTSKAMQVFVSQVTLAAHAAVRGQFDTLTSVINKAWQAEQEQAKKDKKDGKAIDTPIKKFVSREYELVLRACREVIKPAEYGRKLDNPDDRLMLRTPKDVETWARVNDPDLDPVKTASQLDNVIKQLKAMASNFADTDQHALHVAAQALVPWVGSGDTKGTRLRMSRGRMLAAKAHADKPIDATVPEPVTTPVATEEPVYTPVTTFQSDDEYAPLEGVFSVDAELNDALDRLAA